MKAGRSFYRAVLRMYPVGFRERFAGEMLWIFDETVAEVGVWRLSADAVMSVLRQRVAERDEAGVSLGFGTVAQAAVVATFAVAGFFALLQQSVPLPTPPKTFAVRRTPLDLHCDYALRVVRRAR